MFKNPFFSEKNVRLFSFILQFITAWICNEWKSLLANYWENYIVNFANILRVHFAPIFCRQKILNLKHSFVTFGDKILYEKRAHKMLIKLTRIYSIAPTIYKKLFANFLFCQKITNTTVSAEVHTNWFDSLPGVNFNSILLVPFLHESLLRSFSLVIVWLL